MITPNTILFSLLVRHLILQEGIPLNRGIESISWKSCKIALCVDCSTNFKLLTNNFHKAYRLQILWKLLFHYLKVLKDSSYSILELFN